eukprot:g26608.t1
MVHMGNLIGQRDNLRFRDDRRVKGNITDLRPFFKTRAYLSPHSDVVAHMVLDHQSHGHNLIARVAMEHRFGRESDAAEQLVKYLLFSGEAKLESPVAGTAGFAKQFAKRGPFDRRGRSLRQFDLKTRLFKYRLSYLIYSRSFDGLPPVAKQKIYRRLWNVLNGADRSPAFQHLRAEERLAIREISTDMTDTPPLYAELTTALRKISLLGSCASVLGWDEQTYLPPAGAEHRANQLSLVAGMRHELATSPRIGELLSELEASGELGEDDSVMAVNVRESRRQYDRATKLPQRLVEEISRITSLAQQAWVDARKKKTFGPFLPWLEQVVALKREEAEAIGYGDGVPYDALLDDYEPGAKTADVSAVFAALRKDTVALVTAIRESGRTPDGAILTRSYPIDAQRDFGKQAAAAIGFDFNAGRLDEAAHPFCSGFGPGDCRLTTRYDEHHFPGAFFGTLHEAGHGMYEQGLDRALYGTAMGESTSLGIHESQSRMWENCVGRSRAFWSHFYKPAQAAFPEALGEVSIDEFYGAINDVRPSFIRVEADEVTYNLHIMLRFELEQQLMTGDLAPAEVPNAWNERFTADFGITPDNDALGCLQDIHWSAGLFGYFPTYALGNMYAAQFFNAAKKELGDLDAMFARGEFAPLKEWLNTNIHKRGKQYRADKLVEVVTGEKLSHEPLVAQLRGKFEPLYSL